MAEQPLAACVRPQRPAPPRLHSHAAQEIVIGPEDYAAFEQALGDIQLAYGREDVAALWTLATPEMAGYFQEELNENARKGVREAISGVKLLQGDLAEAWREGSTDYATVAMRYAITEQVDRTGERQGRCGRAGEDRGGHGGLDLPSRQWRVVEALGDPAGRVIRPR